MGDYTIRSRARRTLLLILPALGARLMTAQSSTNEIPVVTQSPEDVRLPNGKKQSDEILKADYEKNLKDSEELTNLAKSLEEDIEKDDRFVLSLSSLKKLDDIEKLTKRIRGRMKRF